MVSRRTLLEGGVLGTVLGSLAADSDGAAAAQSGAVQCIRMRSVAPALDAELGG